jgi:general L-amino acid transport system permease protein
VFRSGLLSVPIGQYEAANALGLSYWRTLRLVILPQAVVISIPGQVNTIIAVFKDTTLVLVIGIFDFFTTVKSTLADATWLGFSTEAYLFAASIYFGLCFAMSRCSLHLERVYRLRK